MARKEGNQSHASVQRSGSPSRASLGQYVSRDDDVSPPRTPPSQLASRTGKGKGAGGVRAPRNRPALRDAFGDQVQETEGAHNRKRSNSHELSWSPNRDPRASVVDNMLASLDQFSVTTTTTQHFSSAPNTTTTTTVSQSGEYDPFYAGQRSASLSRGRHRGHTISSSVSSDFSLQSESPRNRGHRSNSSSNFQSSLGRIDSVRVGDDAETRVGRSRTKVTGTGPAVSLAGGRKGSKSSGSSSVDLGAMSANTRIVRNVQRRSSSFDQGYQRPAFAPPLKGPIGQQESYFYDNLDAAPTPTVPVGPRRNDSRNASPAGSGHYRPGSSLSGNQPLPIRRRGSIRSPMAIFHRPEKFDALTPGDPEKESAPRSQNPVDASGKDFSMPTKTPDRGQNRSQHNQSGSAANSGNMGKEKERPGFFKRVFGSSRTYNQPLSQESTPSHSKNPSIQNNMIEISRGENIPPSSANRRLTKPLQPSPMQQVTTGEKSQSRDMPPPTLNKKTSFFRRRKKSITETSNVPLPPLQLQPQWNAPGMVQVDQSPVSSLRHAMDPYLNSPLGAKPNSHGTFHNQREQDRQRRDEYLGRSTIRPVTQRSEDENSAQAGTESSRQISDDDPFPNADILLQPRTAPEPDRRPPAPPQTTADLVVPEKDLVIQSAPATAINTEPSIFSPTQSKVPKRTSSTDWKDKSTAPKDGAEQTPSKPSPGRLWVQPTSSEEDLTTPKKKVTQPVSPQVERHGSSSTVNSDYQSANSKQPSPIGPPANKTLTVDTDRSTAHVETVVQEPTPPARKHIPIITEYDEFTPSEEDRAMAEKLFSGESTISVADTAAWLGDTGPDRARVRKAYMSIFDWQNMSILTAIRSFCSQVKLKGESQQVDRLLEALSTRWVECNPNHGFKAPDVVHTICYSLLLLNTDLHMADIDQKMTKGQFIKNTMPTILRVVTDAAPNAFPPTRGSMLPPAKTSSGQDTYAGPLDSPTFAPRPTNRLTARPSDHSGIEIPGETNPSSDECGPLVKAPFTGRQSAWENQVEIVLRNFYNSIREERLPLLRPEASRPFQSYQSSASLSATTGGMLRRSNSILSKAGSESFPNRGRLADNKSISSRWTSKTRSRPRLYQASLGRASRTSFEDDMSAISPSASSMWSKYSLGKTQTSMSVNSYSSDYPPRGDYQRSIGFANALSQAIIREDADASGDAHEEVMRVVPLLEDESLELAGAPWAKEGMLKHKHHLESVEKRAKDRNWSECFAVIDKGWMRLFQFNVSARSMRQKARNQMAGGVVGGGNWTENAESLGKFSLRQTLASALPSPGYSRARPHVFALSLPNGAVHLFQAGTLDIVKEYVSAANYWSARMSKEPLVGGVSNIEYGWSDAVINMALLENRPSSSMTGPRPSLQNSIRSSIDHQTNSRPKLPGDRIMINDWTPPTVSMMESQLLEVDQLRALTNYVKNIEEEHSRHQELRPAISLAFSSKHPNAAKAMHNWERKSSYLLREIVKFRTYICSLQEAQVLKEKLYKEREEREQDRQKGYENDVANSASVETET